MTSTITPEDLSFIIVTIGLFSVWFINKNFEQSHYIARRNGNIDKVYDSAVKIHKRQYQRLEVKRVGLFKKGSKEFHELCCQDLPI